MCVPKILAHDARHGSRDPSADDRSDDPVSDQRVACRNERAEGQRETTSHRLGAEFGIQDPVKRLAIEWCERLDSVLDSVVLRSYEPCERSQHFSMPLAGSDAVRGGYSGEWPLLAAN